jgi:hypothetical protein
MHQSFIITEEEKKRILGVHQNSSKNFYLNLIKEKNESESMISVEEMQSFLDGIKNTINTTFDNVDKNNIETEKRNLKKLLDSVVEKTKSLGFDLIKIQREVQRVQQIIDKLSLQNIQQIKKEFPTSFLSLHSLIIDETKKLNTKDKMTRKIS